MMKMGKKHKYTNIEDWETVLLSDESLVFLQGKQRIISVYSLCKKLRAQLSKKFTRKPLHISMVSIRWNLRAYLSL